MKTAPKFVKKLIKHVLKSKGFEISSLDLQHPDFPIEANYFQVQVILNAKNYSMTPISRLWALIQAFEYINHNNISGDFVECGVWKGGNLILLSDLQEKIQSSRTIYGFDTFTGMVEPKPLDLDYRGQSAAEMMSKAQKVDGAMSIHAFASLESVEINLSENNAKNVKLIQGDVAETLKNPENLPKKIAILRLDTDWYESTKIELETLYPLLESGGVLIIDDYGHFQGARRAVDEYFKDEKPWMHYVDYACRLVVKK